MSTRPARPPLKRRGKTCWNFSFTRSKVSRNRSRRGPVDLDDGRLEVGQRAPRGRPSASVRKAWRWASSSYSSMAVRLMAAHPLDLPLQLLQPLALRLGRAAAPGGSGTAPSRSSAWQRSRVCSSRCDELQGLLAGGEGRLAGDLGAQRPRRARAARAPRPRGPGRRSAAPRGPPGAAASWRLHPRQVGGEPAQVDPGALHAAAQLGGPGVLPRRGRRRGGPAAPPPRAGRRRCGGGRRRSTRAARRRRPPSPSGSSTSAVSGVGAAAQPSSRSTGGAGPLLARATLGLGGGGGQAVLLLLAGQRRPEPSSSCARSSLQLADPLGRPAPAPRRAGPGPSPGRGGPAPSRGRPCRASSGPPRAGGGASAGCGGAPGPARTRPRRRGPSPPAPGPRAAAAARRGPRPPAGPPVTTPDGSSTSPSSVTSVRLRLRRLPELQRAAGRSRTMSASPRRKRDHLLVGRVEADHVEALGDDAGVGRSGSAAGPLRLRAGAPAG